MSPRMKRLCACAGAAALAVACSPAENANTAAIAENADSGSSAPPAEAAEVADRGMEEAAPAAPTIEDARAFVDEVEAAAEDFYEYAARVYWVQETYINYDTNWLASRVSAESTRMAVDFANRAKAFNDLDLSSDPDLARKLDFIKQGITLPAPGRPGAAEELAEITTRLQAAYSTGKIDLDGEQVALDDLEVMMGEVRDPARLEEIWTKWREVPRAAPYTDLDGPGMAADYAREVEIANEGARELGYDDVGQLWLSKYDMEPDEMAAEVERLWGQVKPLYDELHCYVRAELNEEYGDEIVPLDQPIRADLLGNMWAQQWANIYDIVAPEGADVGYDLTDLLVEHGYTPEQIVHTGDEFFQSLGFDPLPATFWERSQILKPEGREAVCHASAWDLDNVEDVRIKMCTKVNADDFQTVHHELGHNIYQRAYAGQPILFRDGAHDGFHEAIGDFIALSITPEYLRQLDLITADQIPPESADLGLLMNQALDKIAFLPFGLLMDKWRWGIFSGEITPAEYNDAWWALREEYQGIRPPNERPADAFDPGGKYHIPNNVPYLRYFLSFVMQFQFHEAACAQAGWEGPLHRCSIYGDEEVGERFAAMLEAGASQPWPDTLELFTGTREMDGSSIINYFAPLIDYLREENEGRSCGWE